jgi:hypothetical protein
MVGAWIRSGDFTFVPPTLLGPRFAAVLRPSHIPRGGESPIASLPSGSPDRLRHRSHAPLAPAPNRFTVCTCRMVVSAIPQDHHNTPPVDTVTRCSRHAILPMSTGLHRPFLRRDIVQQGQSRLDAILHFHIFGSAMVWPSSYNPVLAYQ